MLPRSLTVVPASVCAAGLHPILSETSGSDEPTGSEVAKILEPFLQDTLSSIRELRSGVGDCHLAQQRGLRELKRAYKEQLRAAKRMQRATFT